VPRQRFAHDSRRDQADLVREAGRARPAGHDVRVVRGDDGDDVDALRLERVVLLQVPGQVVRVARRRERAGDGEQHDLLARPCGRREPLLHAARALPRGERGASGGREGGRTASSSSGDHGT
jgi:hypothetical protein